MSDRTTHTITPDILLHAYASGIFPMAESAEDTEIRWFDPPTRAIIPLDDFYVSRRLARTIRKRPYVIKRDTAFAAVMRACAAPMPDRPSTWINAEILQLYQTLHHRGHAHSIEVYKDETLVGGLYGVSLGGAFFGESMFSLQRDASKIALVYLVVLMRECGFTLLDTQFQTDHLQQFGTFEILRADYHRLLESALKNTAVMAEQPNWDYLVETFLQRVTQIS
jgi:leucyl/phenylalanyl-tRNA--protein transferase